MRILTVRQPWAWAIIHGGKDVENRVRNIAGAYRGPIAIHAGAAWDCDARFPVGKTPHPTSVSLVRGAIIGVVDLVDVHAFLATGNGCLRNVSHARAEVCSPWAEREARHLVLANPRALPGPIPHRGALGLRHLDDDTTARIQEAIA
jgi:hypothetical protein